MMTTTAAVSLVVLSIMPVWAQGQAGWRTRPEGRSVEAFARSETPGAALRLNCANGSIWLTYEPTSRWNGNGAVTVRIGADAFPMVIDGGGGAILSNAPNGGMGVTRAVLDKIRTGQTLVLEGTAAARVPVGQRTFALVGAAAALAAVERTCGGAR
ncbi:hypothetical protein E8L99_08890 [Phreatobacter aquaticus]|uniref:Uncharacterized protein n=1 Tax=Phreatobacter aquaticus TaxID=2570229 RepID=A0A4D7QFC9_9HYPH|nr:hypothetical protein [Phreatobacter aquaticus]QCK85868.1 hypothetical protein E8L99_08890 [Phreatobacter aquaticus]